MFRLSIVSSLSKTLGPCTSEIDFRAVKSLGRNQTKLHRAQVDMSDLAQIMKELGVVGTGGGNAGDNGAVKVEHVLVFSLAESTDQLVRGIVGVLQQFGRHAVQSLRIVAIGSAVGMVLYGTARLIEALRRDDSSTRGKLPSSSS
jgi:hypothetical protein